LRNCVNRHVCLSKKLRVLIARNNAARDRAVEEAASNSNTNLFNAVSYANSTGATEVSMSWGSGEASAETADQRSLGRQPVDDQQESDHDHGGVGDAADSAGVNATGFPGLGLDGWFSFR
jgi:hypothetical protein